MQLSLMLLPLFPLPRYKISPCRQSQVLKELLKLEPKKRSGSDGLDPFFFKVAAPIIARPISDLFNLSPLSGEVPINLKAATVRPVFKEGDQADPVIGLFLFCPVYQKCWKNLSVIN
jgi:hypothetical protein